MTKKEVSQFFERLKKQHPSPRTALTYQSHFELLIAVMLSAQATDVSVNKATPTLFKKANNPQKIFALGEQKLIPYIQTIGLFRSKAKHIIQTCKILIQKFNSEVPNTREALESLPGVGRKTANVMLNEAFGQPTIAVDTHVFRLANRTGLAKGKTPLEVEKKLMKAIPKTYQKHAGLWLILHGRQICFARHPKCSTCPVQDLCQHGRKLLTR